MRIFLTTILALSLTAQAAAEQQTPIAGSKSPEAICSLCEDSDSGKAPSCSPRSTDNYCSCKASTETSVRVLVRVNKKAPLITYDDYQANALKALTQRLKKQKASKAKAKKQIEALRLKLEAQHATYKNSCGAPITTGPQTNGNIEVIARGAYTVQLLSLSGFNHTFASGISERGQVVGGGFQSEAAKRAPVLSHGFGSADLPNQVITPIVWGAGSAKVGCTNCAKGLLFRKINDQGLAVGTRLTGTTPSQEAVTFDYIRGSVTALPVPQGVFGVATSINEAGIISGAVGNASASTVSGVPVSDPAVWVGNALTIIDRAMLITAHNKELAPVMLAEVKARLKANQDLNECGDGEIAQTTLTGQPSYPDWITFTAIDVTKQGDLLVNLISPRVLWNYTGPCDQGVEQAGLVTSTFIRKADGSLTVVPSGVSRYDTRLNASPIDINASLAVVGLANSSLSDGVITSPGILQAAQPNPAWQRLTYTGAPTNAILTPMALNDRGDLVGVRLVNSATDARAYAIFGGTFIDLTSLLGTQSDWVIEAITDINSCGQMVGRARNAKTSINRAVVISPNGCPLAS